jgi:predicted transcriptional regulator
MLARDLISLTLAPLNPNEEAVNALAWMDEMRVQHAPVVLDNKLLGILSEDEVLIQNALDEPISNHQLMVVGFRVMDSQHLFDVIRIMANQKLTLLPVVDQSEVYLGCITLKTLVFEFAKSNSFQQPGSIIVVEVSQHNYSLSEISRIVESNDAKVLSSYINSFPDSTRIEVTIKVNKIDTSAIIQTFNRFNYLVLASYSEESKLDELLSNRYESLMKYLNV